MNIYIWKELVGIYWNSTYWLISVVGSNDIITIADKNLWATTVYNDWDTLSQNNCWYYYQWGNNYWFSWSWPSSTTTAQQNANGYWPRNYYNNSTWVISSNDRSSVQNDNLRWNTTNTLVARKWPCSSWFHVPTKSDFDALISMWTALNISWDGFRTYLKMPFWWQIYGYRTTPSDKWTLWLYRSSTPITDTVIGAWRLYISSSVLTDWWRIIRASWCSIRPFANTPTEPDSSRTVLYQPS